MRDRCEVVMLMVMSRVAMARPVWGGDADGVMSRVAAEALCALAMMAALCVRYDGPSLIFRWKCGCSDDNPVLLIVLVKVAQPGL